MPLEDKPKPVLTDAQQKAVKEAQEKWFEHVKKRNGKR